MSEKSQGQLVREAMFSAADDLLLNLARKHLSIVPEGLSGYRIVGWDGIAQNLPQTAVGDGTPSPAREAARCPDCGEKCQPGTIHNCPYRGPLQVPGDSGGPREAGEGLSVICRDCGTLIAGVEAGNYVRWVTCQNCRAAAVLRAELAGTPIPEEEAT